MDLFFFLECYVHDHAAAENNTGNLNSVPIATAVTNTGTEVMYTVIAKHFKVENTVFGNGFWSLPLILWQSLLRKQTWQWQSDKLNCGYLIYAISICAAFPKKPCIMHRLAFDEKKKHFWTYIHTQKKRTSLAWDRCWSRSLYMYIIIMWSL